MLYIGLGGNLEGFAPRTRGGLALLVVDPTAPKCSPHARVEVWNRKAATKITSEQREEMTLKGRKTRMERYETLGRPVVQTNPYSHARGGTRDDLGFYVRSRWEANYARYLRFLKDKGEIHDWEYEPDIFVFHGEIRGSISYTPDFKVTENNGRVVYHEVKGWMDSKSKTKLKRMKKHYPDVEIIIIAWKEYNAISKYSGLIENWED